jgi:hypothetical protein
VAILGRLGNIRVTIDSGIFSVDIDLPPLHEGSGSTAGAS